MKRRKGQSGRGRLTAAALARLIGWGLALAFTGWWAVRCATVEALARANPFAAALVAKHDPRVEIELAMLEFALRGGRVSPAAERDAYAALDRSALAEEPFLLAAVSALAHGDTARGEALLVEARRRNPRERMVRLLLLDRYLRTGRARDAGNEIAVIDRLTAGVADVLVPELARQAQDPVKAKSLEPVFRANPGLAQSVLARLAATGADPSLILAIASRLGTAQRGAAPEWQATLLERMAKKGDAAGARALWQRFVGPSAPPAASGVYDPDFKGLPGPPPFNWTLVTGKVGTADRVSGGGLQVDYYGREPGVLARQLLTQKPGPQRLRVRTDGGDAKGDGSQLLWSVTCVGAQTPLATIPLVGITTSPRTFEAAYAVPAGCGAQWLELVGKPGDVAAQQSVRLAAVEVQPEGAK